MLKELNSKSKERIRLEEQRAKYEQKLREQIKKDEKRQREREKALKLLIGGLFVKHLPDYMLYEDAEMEMIVAAAMESDDCRNVIEAIRAEAEDLTGTAESQSLMNKQETVENTEPEDMENDESDADDPIAEEDSGEYEGDEESEEDEESNDEPDDEDSEE